MSGVYIHIPFCSRKCNYCDFYSIVPKHRKSDFVEALLTEARERKHYLEDTTVETIYFGGGTPSILNRDDISRILNHLNLHFNVVKDVEITFEANPEDLSLKYLQFIKSVGVNRLSIGVQSFNDIDLVFLNRNHSSNKAMQSVRSAFDVGIDNISIDLIYGLPSMSMEDWESNLRKALELPIKHLSSYHLTYEKGTLLYKKLKQGKLRALNEDNSVKQFEMLLDYTSQNNLDQYEISNFAYKDYYSKHNLSYWQQKKYLGLGPSAHSYNGKQREWNISHLVKYLEGIRKGNVISEKESLSQTDLSNEYLITNLRTKWGVNLDVFKLKFGQEHSNYLEKRAKGYVETKLLKFENQTLRFTTKGLIMSDFVLEKLFRASD